MWEANYVYGSLHFFSKSNKSSVEVCLTTWLLLEYSSMGILGSSS